ncbi:phosphoribosylanthranilate isomerase [Lutibacter sp. HS1-25]|uniref:phosphoribosylanthranilate isomerase n=1 Tax=Lutibacter sp. HS1-25 TaxID=2485000 RepID=UPI00101206DB|nr:phosphoribosylanthranilate isomerase [Lutibacter sp. HS1-25]RXP46556.1 phosphoribosylanthranilate isomerase [Lutibacter sp. HS1-25]
MKIKVCGMRDSENLQSLLALKPDFVGFIFYSKSKRFVSDFPKVDFPNDIKKVGVFVNETIEEVLRIVEKHQLNAVQLHGEETPTYCKELIESSKKYHLERSRNAEFQQLQIFKAFSVDDDFEFSKTEVYQKVCDYLLFDTKGKEYGGNGVKFNWEVLQKYKGKTPFLLSGGISKIDAQVIKKIQHNAFAGVDINSGFEITPALKNINDIKEFKNNLL